MSKPMKFFIGSILFLIIILIIPTNKKESKTIGNEVKKTVKENNKSGQSVGKAGKNINKKVDKKDIIKKFIKDNQGMFMFDESTTEIEEWMQEKNWARGERYNLFLKDNVKGNYWIIYFEGDEIVGVKYKLEDESVKDIYSKQG